MTKKPWERRLKDLSHFLSTCASTYFEPELFRLNLNQFLQISRTVTFIIQKNKNEINGYDNWYPVNVVEKWKNDPLMTWAKDSRNVIEKEGDLEMYSDARATLLFSYIEEQDVEIVGCNEILSINIKKLVQIAKTRIPSGIMDGAVIKSERRWVANTLRDFELLHAITLIYARVYECCQSLGDLVGSPIDTSIPTPKSFDSVRDEKRHVNYIKMKDFTSSKLSYETVSYDSSNIPQKIKDRACRLGPKGDIISVDALVDYYATVAKLTFMEDGYHIPILMFFNSDYKMVDLLSTSFDDQADKFVFWRFAAERARLVNARGFIWVSELWLRNPLSNTNEAIHDMPIIGEKLQIIGVDSGSNKKSISWNVIRENEQAMPTLSEAETVDLNKGQAFFMRPILKAIGGDISGLGVNG